jgi:uncharacterized protein (TIGR02301 family)
MSLRTLSLAAPILAAFILAAAPRPALAQETAGAGPPVETLAQLAELLGQAHAIRSLCNGDADQTWRNYMFNMLAIEAPESGPRKSQLTSAFNRGFRNQSNTTRSCSSDMGKVEAEIAARGRVLAESAANSYLH